MADDGDSIFAKAGFDLPGAKPAAGSEKAAAAPAKGAASMFEAAGFKLPRGKVEAAPKVDSEYPTPAKFEEGVKKYGVNNSPEKTTLQKIHEAIDPATLLKTGAVNAGHDILEHAIAGSALTKAGLSDIGNRNYLPTMPAIDPHTWSPGGVVKTGAGALSVLASPVTGPANALVARPVTELTGNPAIGDRAGFVASSMIPIRAGGKAVEAVAPSTKAVNKLVEAVGAENVPEAIARMRENPRLTFSDVSDPVRTMTQGLIDPAQPAVQHHIAQAVKDRASTLPAAVNSAYTEAMGHAPDVVKMVEGLKARATDAGKGIIEPAVKAAKPVDVTPVVAAIDKEIAADPVGKATLRALKAGEEPTLPLSDYQRRLFQLRGDLRGSWKDRDQMFLDAHGEQGAHKIQTELRAEAQNLLNSASGAERSLGKRLMDMRGKIVDQIDEAAGGTATNAGPYKEGLQKYRDAKQIHEAFEAGFDTLKNRSGVTGLEDRPESFRAWMKDATPEEVVARRIGTRADIDQKIRSAKNQALAGESITRIEYNQEKLRSLFGEKEAGRLIRVMRDAQDEAATNAKLLAGSKTAETLAGQKALEVRKVQGGNPLQYAVPFMSEFLGSQYGIPGVGAAMLGLKGTHLGAQKVGQMHDVARNFEFARNALATGPTREAAIEQVLAHPEVIRELKKRSNALVTP